MENKRPTVLIVDDMTTNLMLMSDLLEDDYNIKLAKNGQEALDIANSSNDIDIILLDVILPDIDGYEICKELKNNNKTKNIPVIFVTAKDSEADEEYGLNLGAIDYIIKPFNKSIVKLRVKNHLEMKLKNDMLEELSMHDGLTHIPNRRYFDETFETTYKDAQRSKKAFALMMIDIDLFKPYNDNYGHGKGDEALKKVAKALQTVMKRPTDLVARYGGEEFVVLLQDTEQIDVQNVATNLLQTVRDLKIKHDYSSVEKFITVSIGVAYRSKESHLEKLEILAAADETLYKVKNSGRNNLLIVNV